MSVEANGHLIYGFVHTDETADLFSLVEQAKSEEEEEEGYAFEELHGDLQGKHGISLRSVGYARVDILYAYEEHASGKGFDITSIKAEALAKTEEYDQKVKAFLQDLGINPNTYTPGWHLLSYMD